MSQVVRFPDVPVTLDRAAAARMLPLPASCGLQNQIKASTHNAFKPEFGIALQKLALTYLLQYAEHLEPRRGI
jgi:hypothetical protein